MNMKKLFGRISIFFIAAIVFLSSGANAERMLKVTGDKDYPPYEYIDEAGNYRGFNVDLMNAIAIELGIEVEYIPADWNTALELVKNGDADLIQGINQSESRAENLIFSQETLVNSQSIFVLKDDTVIFGIDDLKGKTAAVQRGDISKEMLKAAGVKDSNIKEYENQEKAIEALIDKEVDAFAGNRLTGLYYIQKRGLQKEIKIADNISETIRYSIAGTEGKENLIDDINRALKTLQRNGTYEKISLKWFGENIEENEKWKQIAIAVISVLLSLSLIIAAVNRKLKKEVALRTAQLEQENNLREKIIDNVDIGIAAFGRDGKVTACNSLISEILDEDIDIGTDFKCIEILENFSRKVLKKGKFINDAEIKTEDETAKFIRYALIPLKESEESMGFLLSVSDMTKEKKTNEILAQNDKMNSLGILSAGIAHEVRNPLTSIKMFVDMLPNKKEDERFFEKFMSVVPQELGRLDRLTYSLLDYSRQQKPSPRNIEIGSVLEEVLVLIKPYIKKKNIVIKEDIENAEIFIDPYQLKQIILNILMNSVDSIKEKGEIELKAEKKDKFTEIIIKDDGVGIEPENLNKIYELFYTSKASGTGMGLSIVKKLVLENNGIIDIKSEKNSGTEVIIKFFS